jgi:parallel beta-helix repeat protein
VKASPEITVRIRSARDPKESSSAERRRGTTTPFTPPLSLAACTVETSLNQRVDWCEQEAPFPDRLDRIGRPPLSIDPFSAQVCFGTDHRAPADDGTDGTGIALDSGSHDNTIRANSISGNGFAGIVLGAVDRNVIAYNHVFHNAGGMIVIGSSNRVTRNLITDELACEGCGYGLSFEGGTGNQLTGNVVTGALADGIRVESYEPETPPAVDNVIRGNIVRAAKVDGIAVHTDGPGRVTGTVVRNNLVALSGDDGIDVRSSTTTITRNGTYANHDFGIVAVAGVTDGGGNRAAGNGNPAQCSNVVCQ